MSKENFLWFPQLLRIAGSLLINLLTIERRCLMGAELQVKPS
jgi:hypothetical protein